GSFTTVGGQSISRLAHILADKTVDITFNPSPNSTVNALLLSGGVLYAGGAFTQIGGQSVGRVAALDASNGQILSGWLAALPVADNTVEALAIDGTTLYIGGSFANINSQPYSRLAALNAASGALLSFNPGTNSTVYGLAIDGSSLYVGGGFSQIAGQNRNYLAAVDKSTGALVSAFNPNANSTVYSVESRGGFLYIGGSFTQAGGQPRNYLAQLSLTNGTATTWNGNANSTVYSFKNGYAGGSFTQVGGQPRRYAAQINDNGTLNAWNPDVDSYVYSVAQSGNEVLLGGSFQNFRQRSRSYLAAFSLADNRFSDNWTASANSTVYAVRLRDASYLYVGGSFSQAGGQPRNGVAEINAQSGVASIWNPNVSGTVYDLQAVADSIYVIGSFTQASGQARKYAAAFLNTNHSTSTLLPWNPQLNSSGYSLSIAGKRILLGGPFSYLKHVDNYYLLALDKPSKLVLPWKPNPNTTVYSFTLDGSKLYVAGSFSQISGQPRKGLVRYDIAPAAANTLDIAWNASFTGSPTVYDTKVLNGIVYATGSFEENFVGNPRKHAAAFDASTAAVQPWNPRLSSGANVLGINGSDILIGGGFDFLKHESRSNLLIINEKTGLISSWNPAPNSTVYAMAHTGSSLLIGGSFTQAGNQPRNYLAEVNLDNGAATTWNPNLNNTVNDLALSGNKLYVGGSFTTAKGQTRNRLAAFDLGSDIPTGWAPSANAEVNAIEIAKDFVYVGGSFTTLNDLTRNRLGRLDSLTGAPDGWNPNANSTVYDIQSNSEELYVGGGFSQIANTNLRYLASFDLGSGGLRTWDALVNSTVYGLDVDDSLVSLVGLFSEAGGATSKYAAIVSRGAGVSIADFQLGSSASVVLNTDSLLYFGGGFTEAEGFPRARRIAVYRKNFFVSVDPLAPEALGLRIYPNPAREYLYLESEHSRVVGYRLTDLQGRILGTGSIEGSGSIRVADLPAGLYLLQMYDGLRSASAKVIVR
ncbi:MAG: T9SS C-terminal target domain-containing protein, partial [Bacteroidetes bacterium]